MDEPPAMVIPETGICDEEIPSQPAIRASIHQVAFASLSSPVLEICASSTGYSFAVVQTGYVCPSHVVVVICPLLS
jgi:hypothetical protein